MKEPSNRFEKFRILAFCWGSPTLENAYLNLIEELSRRVPLNVTFITTDSDAKLRFLTKGVQAFTVQDLVSSITSNEIKLPPIDLDDLFAYDIHMNWRWVPTAESFDNETYHRFQSEQILRAYTTLWKMIQPHLVLTWNGFISIQKILTILADYYNVPVFYLERGLMPDTLSIDPEGINYGSHVGGEKWNKINPVYPTSKDIKQGKAYRERINREATSIVPTGKKMSSVQIKEYLNIPPENSIILLPLQIEADSNILYYSPHYASMLEIIKDIQKVLKNKENITLVVKPHPEDKNRMEEIKSIIGEQSRVVTDINLYSLLKISDIVVVVNSTVGLEALTQRKPVVVLGNAIYGSKGFTYDLKEKSSLKNLIYQALADSDSDSFNEMEFFRFFVYLLKNSLFNLNREEDIWGSREHISQTIVKKMKGISPSNPELNKDLNAIMSSNTQLMNVFNKSAGSANGQRILSILIIGFSDQTANFLKLWVKEKYPNYKCDHLIMSPSKLLTLLPRLPFKKYDIAIIGQNLRFKSKIIWSSVRANYKIII
jgi:capsular polysaccharide export protein